MYMRTVPLCVYACISLSLYHLPICHVWMCLMPTYEPIIYLPYLYLCEFLTFFCLSGEPGVRH